MDLGVSQALGDQNFGETMAASFQDELEKLSISPGYLAKKVLSGGKGRGIPRAQVQAAAKKVEQMQALRLGGVNVAPREIGKVVRKLKKGYPRRKGLTGKQRVAVGAGAVAIPALLYARHKGREKAAAAGDLQPPSGYGRGEDGAPGLKEQVMGAQLDLERGAEDARQVGEPKSDKLQKVLQRLQGTSGEAEVKVRALQQKAAAVNLGGLASRLKSLPYTAKKLIRGAKSGQLKKEMAQERLARKDPVGGTIKSLRKILRSKTSQAQTIPVTREDVIAAAGKARKRRVLVGLAGTAGGAALGSLLRPRAAGAAIGSLGGLVAGSGVGGAMAGSSFRKELMRRAKSRQERQKTSVVGALLGGSLLARQAIRSPYKKGTETAASWLRGPATREDLREALTAGAVGAGLGAGAEAGIKKLRSKRTKTSAVTSVGYSKYFRNKMHTRGITSPTQLSEKGKKEFFQGVDKGWHSSREKFQKLKGGAPLA